MTREVSYRSVDFSQVPAILVAPSGQVPDAAVNYSEVDQMVTDLNAAIANLRNDSEQADAADTSAWQSAVETINNNISLLQDRVTGQVTVGHKSDTVAEAQAYLTALAASVPPDSHQRKVLIASETDTSINGIYVLAGAAATRHPDYVNASDFRAGFEIYVDDSNRKFKIADDGTSVSESNPAIASVEILPWTRIEEILAESPLQKVGPALRLLFDAGYLAVENSQLTLSTTFKQQIAAMEALGNQHTTQISSLESNLAATDSKATTNQGNIANLTTGLSSTDAQVQSLNTFQSSAESRLTATETATSTNSTKIETLESSQAAQDTELGLHAGQISDLSTTQQTISADVNTLKTVRPQHDGRITTNTNSITTLQTDVAGLKATDTQHGDRLTALEAGAALLGQVQAKADSNETQIGNINTAITDANATIAANTNSISDLTAQLSGTIDSAALAAAFEAHIASQTKKYKLTTGVTEQRVDTDDGRTYYFTTFEMSSGFGSLDFEVSDLSEAVAPHTKLADSFTFQRVSTDSFRVTFQNAIAAYPDDYAEITLRKSVPVGN